MKAECGDKGKSCQVLS